MPTAPKQHEKTTPDDATIVQRLQAMGAKWDGERWIVPTDREPGLRRLLADIGRPVEWRGAEAA